MRKNLGLASLAMLACLGATQRVAGADSPSEEAATPGEALTGGKLLLQLRPRWEYVQQENKPDDANAVTMRTLLGWRTKPWHGLSATVEGINVGHLDSQGYNDNFTAASNYPTVADPDVTQINQLYGEYTGLAKTDIKVGWQIVKLDNLRFVGNVDFRQVMQVFDAAGIENKSIDKLNVYVSYLWRQRNILGQQIGMQMPVVNLRYGWKPGNDVVGYVYLQDQAKTGQNAATGFANDSNQIWGLRANGTYPLGEKWKLLYTAEYAKQQSYADGNALIDAQYYHLGIGGKWGEIFARVDQEMLGSNDGQYGFQTPLATLHIFQGWADQFLTTPKEGIRDTYLSAGAKVWKLLLYAEGHKFESTFGGFDLGNEFDVGVTWPVVKWFSAKIEYADYHAGSGGPPPDTKKVDVQKFWLTLNFQF
jgi:hypothetical protein